MFTAMKRLLLLFAIFTTLWVGAVATNHQPPIYVNVGGPNYTDVNGNDWISDKTPQIYNTGKAYKTLKTIEDANNELQPIYQTERWTRKSSLQFDIPIDRGDYLDSLEYENLDIVSLAGGPYTALTMETTTSVHDGVLSIRLDKVLQNPKLNGIAVLPSFGVDGFTFVNADASTWSLQRDCVGISKKQGSWREFYFYNGV